MNEIRKHFLRGLLISCPLFLTVWFFTAILSFFDEIFFKIFGDRFNFISGTGFFILVVLITFIGFLFGGVTGAWFISRFDKFVRGVPVIGSIYMALKSILESIISSNKTLGSPCKVCFSEKTGCIIFGFVMQENKNNSVVFIPTSPNPTSGLIVIFKNDAIEKIDVSRDVLLRFIFSVGVGMSLNDILNEKDLKVVSEV